MGVKNTGWGDLDGPADGPARLLPPIRLVSAESGCLSCGDMTRVYAVVAEDVLEDGVPGGNPAYVYHLCSPPEVLAAALADHAPDMALVDPGDGVERLLNHCGGCGKPIDDVELHETSGPFVGRPAKTRKATGGAGGAGGENDPVGGVVILRTTVDVHGVFRYST